MTWPLHPGVPPAPHDLWQSWSVAPLPLLLLAGTVYAIGLRRVWRRAGRGHGIRVWRARCYALGLLVLLVALVSPLDALGAALFSAHMAQHTLLMLVAAPLLVLGTPHVALLWALRRDGRTRAGGGGGGRAGAGDGGGRRLLRPYDVAGVAGVAGDGGGGRGMRRHYGFAVMRAMGRQGRAVWLLPLACVLYAAALWLWHAPPLYQAALRSEWIHVAEHASLFGSALLFWWAVGIGRRARGIAVLAVFATAVQSSVLGALMLTGQTPWYPAYALTTASWGMTALADQQLAAAIMVLPCDLIYLAAALALAGTWMAGRAGGGDIRPKHFDGGEPRLATRNASALRAERRRPPAAAIADPTEVL